MKNGHWKRLYCKICNKNIEEGLFYDFLKTHLNEDEIIRQYALKNTKNKSSYQRLDFFIPKLNLGIEYNGIYWHSNLEDKNYHLKKTQNSNQLGIELIHIFSTEWADLIKSNIWKSVIINKLKKTGQRIFARKCEIKEITESEKNIFLNLNHLQGEDRSKIKIGLFFNNELVAIGTFGKARFNKKYEYELLRFCNKLNCNVIGGFSKILSYFEKQYKPNSLITYADRRYSNGQLYEKNNFTFLRESSPNYWYWKQGTNLLISRHQCQKHKLPKLLGNNFNPIKTELQNMLDNDYSIIYDCGNFVYIKEKERY